MRGGVIRGGRGRIARCRVSSGRGHGRFVGECPVAALAAMADFGQVEGDLFSGIVLTRATARLYGIRLGDTDPFRVEYGRV